MSTMERINLAHVIAFPAGLGIDNLHTHIAGMEQDPNLLQQGDLYFERLDGMPLGNRRPTSNSLAVSATTGKSHIAEGDVRVWQPLDNNGNAIDNLLYLEVGSGGAQIVHSGGDHATMPVGEGVHAVSGVVDIDPLDEGETLLRRAD